MDEHELLAKSTSFKLTKLRDYEGDNKNERLFLNDLFRTMKKPVIASLSDFIGLIKNNKRNKT
jgi:hypothetical protein